MLPSLRSHGALQLLRYASRPARMLKTGQVVVIRLYTIDGRSRLTANWSPTIRGSNADPSKDDAHALLVKAGFLQQAYSGVFQLLPLGLRVQEKIERLVDKHMQSLGASKVSLSCLTSEGVWRRTGRLEGGSELLRVRSRAKDAFLLAPTHEEEITRLVADKVKSAKDLPLRLYQISRKFRDERRPRQGLLRTREFLMKDLYTFDTDEANALVTYAAVKAAYNNFFEQLGIPFLVAEADTGSIGGTRSHEFHFPSPAGEDTIISCAKCDYVANEELAEAYRVHDAEPSNTAPIRFWTGITHDGLGLVRVAYRAPETSRRKQDAESINTFALKRFLPDIDTGVENPLGTWLKNLRESLVPDADLKPFRLITVYDDSSGTTPQGGRPDDPLQAELATITASPPPPATPSAPSPIDMSQCIRAPHDLLTIRPGDHCPRCKTGTLTLQPAIELGHTFHLGTRYSAPLSATIPLPSQPTTHTPISMGCHGIGISRLIAASAAALADSRGLNWPRAIAPFETLVVPGTGTSADDAAHVHDMLRPHVDVAIDDRDHSLVQKLRDADIVGFPVLVVLGRDWAAERRVEVQCRRLGVKTTVDVDGLGEAVVGLLDRLGKPGVSGAG